jgi:hypothetical protein
VKSNAWRLRRDFAGVVGSAAGYATEERRQGCAANLFPLALFSFRSNIALKNIPGISTYYSDAEKSR